ncbi:unnamed protein product [Effrenium voratum]|uniref:Phosphoglucomutase n=1 Tax=Effrenium voratum TaxID=2562239 RepID=A0AA36J2N7_9DINO|nr:unnamed protein product [Effrenium voratum]
MRVTTLVDKSEEALDKDKSEEVPGLELQLREVVERLRKESEKIWPKISAYEASIAELSNTMCATQKKLHAVRHTPTREADDLRTLLKAQINEVKRMMAQLGRLRDIQRVNAQEIGMVERERAKLSRYCQVRELLKEGDRQKLSDKIRLLQDDTDKPGACSRVGAWESDADWRTWAELWASWDPNEATRAALLAESPGSLRKLLGARLEFGTAGLRGPMGLGSAQMNDLVVLQTTQGVCAYLESRLGEAAPRRVCVGFDHRAGAGCTSRSFALQVAKVFLQRGFDVWLYRDFVATPLVPWAMERRGCCCGVMITASHNPKLDNGYKLYWSNCAQIIPPHDAKVAALIEENLEPWSQEALEVLEHPRCKDPVGEGLLEDYFHSLRRLKSAAPGKDLPVVYTAMHGVGRPFVERAFEAFGHRRPQVVAEQGDPDPEFPTVAFPNPEEGKGALALAFDLAAASGCDLVLANDPDADRLAAAERQPGGAWHVFTGNELGALLGHWAWRLWRQSHPDQSPDKVCMVASTVSSKFLGRVAATEGFRFVETLTGFKWMGSKSGSLRDQGFEVIFAFEEAIGFCVGDLVKDKDGISAAAVFVDMARALRESNKRCLQHLEARDPRRPMGAASSERGVEA